MAGRQTPEPHLADEALISAFGVTSKEAEKGGAACDSWCKTWGLRVRGEGESLAEGGKEKNTRGGGRGVDRAPRERNGRVKRRQSFTLHARRTTKPE